MGKRELVALLNLSSWCLVMVERLFLAVPRGCLRFVIAVFPDHTHYFCSNGPGHKSSLEQIDQQPWVLLCSFMGGSPTKFVQMMVQG